MHPPSPIEFALFHFACSCAGRPRFVWSFSRPLSLYLLQYFSPSPFLFHFFCFKFLFCRFLATCPNRAALALHLYSVTFSEFPKSFPRQLYHPSCPYPDLLRALSPVGHRHFLELCLLFTVPIQYEECRGRRLSRGRANSQ